MKTSPVFILGLLLTAAVSSCAVDGVQAPLETPQGKLFTPDEEKVVATFDSFLDRLGGDPQSRSSIMGDARITSVRQTTTAAYRGGGDAQTRSEGSGMPVYELTLTNPDNTTGFAVVADPETVDEVIAYAPLGSFADTVFNKGLAMYFQELAALADAVDLARQQFEQENAQDLATRNYGPGGYWDPNYKQPGWDDIFNVTISDPEFYRWLTPDEMVQHQNDYYSWSYQDPIDYTNTVSASVPTRWGQGNPYNNRVPVRVTARPWENVVVGCFAVAVGQLMAFHKYPSTYNWNMLTATETIPVTPTNDGGIILSQETSAQKEVSRLLYNMAVAGNTKFRPGDANGNGSGGATNAGTPLTVLPMMGYTVTRTYMETAAISSSLMIKEEISTWRRPVLYCAEIVGEDTGHIWVIDGVLTQERWGYSGFSGYGYSEVPSGWKGLNRYRAQGNLVHCNWGWYGYGDGWFYNFNAPHYTRGFAYLMQNKYLYTGIKPQ